MPFTNRDIILIKEAAFEARLGRAVNLVWYLGDEVKAPPAGTKLVVRKVPEERVGFIYGIFISSGEPNTFKVSWISRGLPRSLIIDFGGRGTVLTSGVISLNEEYPADSETEVFITNVVAGSVDVVYQAGLLIGECS